MEFSAVIAAITQDPTGTLKTVLRIGHFVGLALGVGAATALDLIILKFFIVAPVDQPKLDVFRFCTKIVNVGLWILWLTGAAFLVYYWAYDPIKLTNEKVWAKLLIVSILTVNGIFIHSTIFPFLEHQKGKRLLEDLTKKRRAIFVTSGVISITSWYAPLIIGAFSQLNFKVPMLQIVEIYGFILAAAMLVTHFMLAIGKVRQTAPVAIIPAIRKEPTF